MKTVTITISVDPEEAESCYKSLPCYDGLIDGTPSWYGGMIRRIDMGEDPNKAVFSHDMPNREWEDWLDDAKRCLKSDI